MWQRDLRTKGSEPEARNSELESRSSKGLRQETFVAKINVQKNAHLYQVFAMSGTERSVFATDRSSELESSDLEA